MKKGISLIEILLGMSILAVFAGPLAFLFLSSKRTNYSAKDLSVAMNLSSTYISALKDLPRPKINILPPTVDSAIHGDYSPQSLDIPQTPTGYYRYLEIRPLVLSNGLPDSYLLIVRVRWERGNQQKRGEYFLETILAPQPGGNST